MEAVKEKLINAITVMDNEDAVSLWEYLNQIYEQKNILASVEEVTPTEEESRIMDSYEHGEAQYQPYISHEELKRQLGI